MYKILNKCKISYLDASTYLFFENYSLPNYINTMHKLSKRIIIDTKKKVQIV